VDESICVTAVYVGETLKLIIRRATEGQCPEKLRQGGCQEEFIELSTLWQIVETMAEKVKRKSALPGPQVEMAPA
jgi:hypothetical protein